MLWAKLSRMSLSLPRSKRLLEQIPLSILWHAHSSFRQSLGLHLLLRQQYLVGRYYAFAFTLQASRRFLWMFRRVVLRLSVLPSFRSGPSTGILAPLVFTCHSPRGSFTFSNFSLLFLLWLPVPFEVHSSRMMSFLARICAIWIFPHPDLFANCLALCASSLDAYITSHRLRHFRFPVCFASYLVSKVLLLSWVACSSRFSSWNRINNI